MVRGGGHQVVCDTVLIRVYPGMWCAGLLGLGVCFCFSCGEVGRCTPLFLLTRLLLWWNSAASVQVGLSVSYAVKGWLGVREK